ncbi:protein of unknown function (plasmid) [Caballeronia sp. S22]
MFAFLIVLRGAPEFVEVKRVPEPGFLRSKRDDDDPHASDESDHERRTDCRQSDVHKN